MEVTAKLRNLRIAPRKVRLVAELIRKKRVQEARQILSFATKRSSNPMLKLLNSAVANAKNNFQMETDNLYISKLLVDEGPKMKRWMPRARGSAYEIQKKTSHITLVLDQAKGSTGKKAKVVSKESVQTPVSESTEIKEVKESKKKTFKKADDFSQKPLNKKGTRRFFQRKAM